ncbi:hypothetical protein D3C87_89710 [compost metagenome]
MKLKFAMTAILTLFVSSMALADEMGPNGDKFYEDAARFETACQTDPCKTPYSRQLVYNQKTKANKMTPEITQRLRAVAFDQAQTWGDTILGGDYYAAGRTRLDEVVAYYKKDKLIGYKIRYSEKAWYTADCGFDGTRNSLKECKTGRIIEGSYVSADTLTYFSDEEKYAEFSFLAE